MEKAHFWYGNHDILQILNGLPRKIIGKRDLHNVAEFVLYELCKKDCFDIPRAAYIIDNPDYDCMKGIAGYCQSESFNKGDIWDCPIDFSAYMQESPFNQKVRSFKRHSYHRHKEPYEAIITDIAQQLALQSFGCCIVQMPHDNHGFFMYEKQIESDPDKECLLNGASLLSFCPIY